MPDKYKDNHRWPLMRPHSNLAEQLPGPYPGAVNAALARYIYLASSNLPEFSEADWKILQEACKGWDSQKVPPSDLAQALVSKAKEWGAEALHLRDRLASLSAAQAIAVIYAIELSRSG